MYYVKSFLVGILGAGTTGLILFAYRVYQGFQSHESDIHITDVYYPAWIPYWAVQRGIDLWFRARSNAAVLLVLSAFVMGFCWKYYSMRQSASSH
jgi:hypothetical protein